MDFNDLTAAERKAIRSLEKLATEWPKTLWLFSNNGTLEVHKGGQFSDESVVAVITGIRNDGGDRD